MAIDEGRESRVRAGQWLDDQRVKVGYPTAKAFADEIGVSSQVLSSYIRGVSAVSDPEMVVRIAHALRRSVVEVMRGLEWFIPSDQELAAYVAQHRLKLPDAKLTADALSDLSVGLSDVEVVRLLRRLAERLEEGSQRRNRRTGDRKTG